MSLIIYFTQREANCKKIKFVIGYETLFLKMTSIELRRLLTENHTAFRRMFSSVGHKTHFL